MSHIIAQIKEHPLNFAMAVLIVVGYIYFLRCAWDYDTKYFDKQKNKEGE